jgi:hypothetical protein
MMEDSKERLAMSVEELQRMNAMDNAVRHRLKEESPEQVVQAAQKYLDFLQGKRSGG